MGIDKFQQTEGLLRCPLCKDGLRMEGASLRCGKGHCFDISAKGYVCFLPGGKPSGRYNRAFFESRRRILEAGFYDHILEGIQSLSGLRQAKVILDTGCGEGYYAKRLREELDACVLGLDYSQDGIRLAASGGNRVCWMAADLANIPLRDHRAECVLNLFTPANYGEFGRVLATGGLLVKAIPGPEHLAELREQVRGRLRRVAHSGRQLLCGPFPHGGTDPPDQNPSPLQRAAAGASADDSPAVRPGASSPPGPPPARCHHRR